jgi:Zn-dependent protease with chaperone function
VIAVVGTVRPRVFIASQIFQSLTKEELSAALEHEAGHILARDNLKRGLMRACRDTLLLVPCGRLLDNAWKEASEAAADEHAARRGSNAALDLASALVKIARMIPQGAKPGMPAVAALLVGLAGHNEAGSVAHRVRRLSQYADATSCRSRSSSLARAPVGIAFGLIILLIGLTINEPHVLAVVHSLIEHGVRILD